MFPDGRDQAKVTNISYDMRTHQGDKSNAL